MKMTKKSSKWFRLGAILMSVSLITCYLLSSTLAKYTSAYYGTDSARVAQFSFGAAGLGADGTTIDLFATMLDDQVLDTNGTNEDISGDKLIAPGTQGYFDLTFTGNAEVDSSLVFDISDGTTLADYEDRPERYDRDGFHPVEDDGINSYVVGLGYGHYEGETWVPVTINDGNLYTYDTSNHNLGYGYWEIGEISTATLPIVYSVQIGGVTKYYSNFFAPYSAAVYAFLNHYLELAGSEQAFRDMLTSALEEDWSSEDINYVLEELDMNATYDTFDTLTLYEVAEFGYYTFTDGKACVPELDLGTYTLTLPEAADKTTITIEGSLSVMSEDLAATVEAGTDYSTKNVRINWFWAFDADPINNGAGEVTEGDAPQFTGQNNAKDTYWANLAAEGTEITSTLKIKVTATQID